MDKHLTKTEEQKEEQSKELTTYFLVNADLNMKGGKLASQVSHATRELMKYIYDEMFISVGKTSDVCERYYEWSANGSKTIILKVPFDKLKQFEGEPESVTIHDAGRTQIPENSLTVIGFAPSRFTCEKFKEFKLYS